MGFHYRILHESITIHLLQLLNCDENVCSVNLLHVEVKIVLNLIRLITYILNYE